MQALGIQPQHLGPRRLCVQVPIAQHHTLQSIAQVVLRWHIQEGLIVFPKTSHKDRLVENLAIFDFEISPEDMDEIRGFDAGHRVGAAPADGNWD